MNELHRECFRLRQRQGWLLAWLDVLTDSITAKGLEFDAATGTLVPRIRDEAVS